MIVRLGEWDARNDHEPGPHEDINVQNIIIHPKYDAKSLRNDYALLVLKVNNIMI